MRSETRASNETQLLFVTPGVLIKRLHTHGEDDGGKPFRKLEGVTHVFMDEIHERDKNTEFLMIAMRDLMEEREDLQLVLMSATMPTRELAEYWCGVGRRRRRQQGRQNAKGSREDDVSRRHGGVTKDDDWGEDELAMPAEINIPGRTFPVHEFFLEDVLAMTGFVKDIHGAFEPPDMARIESDLKALLSGPTSSSAPSAKISSEGGDGKSNAVSSSLLLLENTLTCVMCNQSGFKCPEEFGTHVALCDGGGNVSMSELEDRVKAVDVSSILGFDEGAAIPASGEKEEPIVDIDEGIFDAMEDDAETYDDTEDEPGLLGGKWDGESPFVVDSVGPSNKPTLTEEEMLTRYQTMFDDEEINYDLVLELVRYVVKSSYGDGAILGKFCSLLFVNNDYGRIIC